VHLILTILFLFSTESLLASELEERLMADWPIEESQFTPTSIDPKEAFKKVREAIKYHKEMSPTKEAEYFYQAEVEDSPCHHCPEYLKLIREVNQIAEKVPEKRSEDVAIRNEAMIQLNRLKFMYYETRLVEEEGDQGCLMYYNMRALRREEIPKDSLILLAEEALSLKNVTSFQFYPREKDQATHYFYRGEGEQANIIIEVVVYNDKKAVIRYHHYKEANKVDKYNLPYLGSEPREKPHPREKEWNPMGVKDLDLNAKGEVHISETYKVASKSEVDLKEQSAQFALVDSAGKNWVSVDTKHRSAKEVSVRTFIPVEWQIAESGLKVQGNVEYERTASYKDKESSEETSAVFALTDHNHEYLRTSVVSRDHVKDVVALSSRFNLGAYGSVTGQAERDAIGQKTYSISHRVADKTSAVTTRLGVDSEDSKFFEIQRETRIGDNSSMILAFKTSEDKETYVMYQYKTKF
jgi:hypothetical protein